MAPYPELSFIKTFKNPNELTAGSIVTVGIRDRLDGGVSYAEWIKTAQDAKGCNYWVCLENGAIRTPTAFGEFPSRPIFEGWTITRMMGDK